MLPCWQKDEQSIDGRCVDKSFTITFVFLPGFFLQLNKCNQELDFLFFTVVMQLKDKNPNFPLVWVLMTYKFRIFPLKD